MNWACWPDAETDCAPGVMVSAVIAPVLPPVTVKLAVAVTTVPFVLVAMAEMVTVPWLTAVASPPEAMVAICVLLEPQMAWLVRSSVAPEDVVPMARNWEVSPGEATD